MFLHFVWMPGLLNYFYDVTNEKNEGPLPPLYERREPTVPTYESGSHK